MLTCFLLGQLYTGSNLIQGGRLNLRCGLAVVAWSGKGGAESLMDAWSQREWRQALGAPGTEAECEAYERLWAYLYPCALRLSHGDEMRATEMAQETMVRVYENLHRFEWRSQVTTWAFSILLNVSNRAYRRQGRELPTEDLGGNPDRTWEEHASIEEGSDLAIDLEHCSGQLNPSQRLAVSVRTREMSAAQVADRLETTPTYVYKLVYTACRILRECLEAAGWGRTRFLSPEGRAMTGQTPEQGQLTREQRKALVAALWPSQVIEHIPPAALASLAEAHLGEQAAAPHSSMYMCHLERCEVCNDRLFALIELVTAELEADP